MTFFTVDSYQCPRIDVLNLTLSNTHKMYYNLRHDKDEGEPKA